MSLATAPQRQSLMYKLSKARKDRPWSSLRALRSAAQRLRRDDEGASRGTRTDAVMTVTVAHVGGRPVRFIPELTGRRAPWDQVLDAASGNGAPIAASATIRHWNGQASRAWTVPLVDLRGLKPDDLLDVRRPVAYQGMSNYVSTLCVPTARFGGRSVWCESFNEQANYRDFLLRWGVAQFATQMLRMEWVLAGGIRVHFPDALALHEDGRVTLIDVTTTKRLEDERAAAIFALTRRTSEALGWRYELLTELTPQRVRNVNALWAKRAQAPDRASTWRARSAASPDSVQFQALASMLGDHGPAPHGVLYLIANRWFRGDLDRPLRPESTLWRGRK